MRVTSSNIPLGSKVQWADKTGVLTFTYIYNLALGKVPFWLVAVFAYVAPYTTSLLRNITPGRPHFGHFFRTVGPVLPFVLYKVNEFVLFICFTFLGLVSLFKGCSLFVYSHLFYSLYSSFNFRRLFGTRQSTARVSLAHVVMHVFASQR